MRSLIDDINTLHIGIFGWPIDRYTPIEDLMQSSSFQEATRKLLRTARARHVLRDDLPLWGEDKWVCTEYEKLRIWVNLRDSYVSRGVLEGNWERDEATFVSDHLAPGDAMLDVGANVGVYTLQAARAVGETGRVHAFEPQADVSAMLSRSIGDNGFSNRCVVHGFALGERDAEATIWRHHDTNPGASFITNDGTGERRSRTQVRRLDSLTFDRRVTLVKMDVEGFEPLVMAGGETFFREHRPLIVTEWFPRSMTHVAKLSSTSFFDQLTASGYAVHRLEGTKPGTRMQREDLPLYESAAEPFNIVCLPN